MLGITPHYVTEEQQPELLFSVCSLVASDEKYQRLLESFEKQGFDASNTEFLALDNRGENRFDGYNALRRVFPQCKGKYILLTHDDIELVEDGAEKLTSVLNNLEARDPNWMVAGNAGWSSAHPERLVLHLNDPHGDWRDARSGPVDVMSLDENLLILPRARMVFPSVDLNGFHLFALDMCMQSRMAGGRSYVVPFRVKHHSGGSASAAFEESRARFTDKYAALHIPHRLRTPAACLYVGARGRLQKVIDDLVERFGSKFSNLAQKAGSKKKSAAVGSK
ncbi:hypothetical protein [Marivita hallyeonensis]|uniref:Glycosyltransferase like family protein n=1 Tax=Marivita hallyeonensis TaxID=996342 RepID=A0A1M5TF89_9RHOB|nr:hypothetical protein [Marivita hallyeonensis]SHH49331.1 hypothetical protein SAMN05443551_2207 [Marivita hallyeonensis]